MGILIRTVLAIPLMVFFTIVAWMAYIFIDPFAATILGQSAVEAVGFLDPMTLVLNIGIRYVMPGMALAVVIWLLFGAISADQHQRRGRR